MLKNETIIETPEDVAGVLELCHVLVKDQSDGSGMTQTPSHKDTRRQGPHLLEREEMAEEQGWVARMIHLFRAESLDVQFEVSSLPILPLSLILSVRFSSCKWQENISRLVVSG